MTEVLSPLTEPVDVHAEVEGDLNGSVPLVFVHGVGSSAASWSEVYERLPAGRPRIRYDLRGHGSSPAPPGPWSVDDFVADHLRLLDRLGVRAADTVGFSLGGLIAQRIAIVRPDLVRRLVVIGSVAGRTQGETERVLARLAMVEAEGPGGAAGQSVERWYTREYLDAHPQVAADTVARMGRLDPTAYTNAYRVLATTDLAGELDRIDAPVLAMTGEFDVGSPPRMSRLIAVRTGGRFVEVPGVKHEVLQERPDLVTKEIVDHVA